MKNGKVKLFAKALEALEAGKQEEAKQSFATLLQEEAENIEYQAGFFCAGWWLNRINDRFLYRPGRPLAAWYMKHWEKFTFQVKERNYINAQAFHKTMRYILGCAAQNFSQAFQEEGTGSADIALLKDLALCLLQLKDYSNAIDILQYARNKKPHDAQLCFLLGESLCCLSQEDNTARGLSFYRDSFLLDLQCLELRWISSPLAEEVLKEIKQFHGIQEDTQDITLTLAWFPAHLLLRSFHYTLRQLKEKEMTELDGEIKRLFRERDRAFEKYHEQIVASLSFYLLVFIHQCENYGSDQYRIQEYERELSETKINFYKLYQKKRQSGYKV